MSDDKLNSALNLMRRMPPSSTENSLAGLLELAPDLTDELLTHVDQPLKNGKDLTTGKDFVLCDYNRDGDSYRSPWSNKYFPEMDDGFVPNDKLREQEILANKLFDIYRQKYFNGGVSSAYFFETDEKSSESFGACFLVHKDIDKQGSFKKGWWDSIHVFEVNPSGEDNKSIYKLTTTVMISMVMKDKKIGSTDLSGLRTKQKEETLKTDKFTNHVTNMGTMLEDIETQIRTEIESIYIQKTRTVIDGMRSVGDNKKEKQWGDIQASLNEAVFHRKEKDKGKQ